MDIVEDVFFPMYLARGRVDDDEDGEERGWGGGGRDRGFEVIENEERSSMLLGYILTTLSQRMFFHMLLASVDPENQKHRYSSDKLTVYVTVIILIVAIYPSIVAHFSRSNRQPNNRRHRRGHRHLPVEVNFRGHLRSSSLEVETLVSQWDIDNISAANTSESGTSMTNVFENGESAETTTN
ncbi:uncharacterized protein LOC142338656 isoform X1 [Convolutriloba macropyga]|uniref:uncharacterized protein LOC142338656 isoform X1 n=1 Tax=Convolutriloba macropyga TaxID=536237 RepID=UPI003F521B7C